MSSESRIGPFVSVDVISDVICPWCYIGKRKLEAVIASFPSLDVHIRWRPYQLDPNIPPDGLDRYEWLERKLGRDRIEPVHAEIAAIGREVGLNFAFEKIRRAPNTIDAHRLVRLAKIGGIQNKVVERLFKGYFVEGLDVGNRRVLVELGCEAGLDRETLENLFGQRDDIQSVKEELATTRRLGISGVPFYIFGEDIVVPGVPSKEVFAAALAKACEAASPAA
jgi:predicted DsbA family dithiol-disulfide isomerase